MKKIFTSGFYWLKKPSILLKIMFLLICFILSSLNFTFGQYFQTRNDASQLQDRINLEIKDQNLVFILDKIEQQSDVVFIYSNDMIEANKKISFKASNQALEKVLKELLAPHGIAYQLYGKQIVLSSKNEKIKKIKNRINIVF